MLPLGARELDDWLGRRGDSLRSIVCFPFSVTAAELEELRADPRIVGVIVPPVEPDLARRHGEWLGCYLPIEGLWELPTRRAKRVVVVAPRSCVRDKMLLTAWRQGARELVAATSEGVESLRIDALMVERGTALVLRQAGKQTRRLPWLAERFGTGLEGAFRSVLTQGRERLGPLERANPRRIQFVRGGSTVDGAAQGGAALGGSETQQALTACELSRRGFDTSLLSVGKLFHSFEERLARGKVGWLELWPREPRVDPPEVRALCESVDALGALPSHVAVGIVAMFSHFVRARPAVVQASLDLTNVWAGFAALLAGVPRVVLATQSVSPLHYPFYESFFRPAYRVLAEDPRVEMTNNSPEGAADYAKWLGLPAARFRVVPNAVNPEEVSRPTANAVKTFREDLGIPAAAPVVGSVFRFAPEKRPLLWLEVAEEVIRNHSTVHFLLVGGGPLEAKIRAHLERSEAKSRIHLVPARTEIATPIVAMDLFLLTSSFEGSPVVLVDAGALGVPVLATDVGGVRYTIDAGRSGWLVPARAGARAIAGEVRRLLADETTLRAAAAAGPPFVAQRFGLDSIVASALEVYGLAS